MEKRSAKRPPEQPSSWARRCTAAIRQLRERISRQERSVPGEFLKGAAYKLGSGAVTLIILWWEARH